MIPSKPSPGMCSKRPWTHWYALPFIDYGGAIQTAPVRAPDTSATEYVLGSRSLEKGSKGTDVKTLQELLIQLGYSLPKFGADGDFGSETLTAVKAFVGINFLEEQVPDATTLLKFRHLLEKHNLGEAIFNDIKERLQQAGLMMRGGTIMDATIIHSTSSTKNKEGKRDPEMHQTKKGNQWYHGMKVHSGVDCGSGYVHTITGTSANVHDLEEAPKLIREDDGVVYSDSRYLGLPKRPEIKNDKNLSQIKFRINRRPSSLNVKTEYDGINWEQVIEHRKSAVRCKVEHPFLIVKRQFGYCKTAYRGIAKNMNRFHMLFGCANLLMCIRGGRAKEFCSVCLG